MKERISIFLYDLKRKKFLLFINKNSLEPQIVIELKKGEENTYKDLGLKIKNIIGINPDEIFSLNWGGVYKVDNEEFKQINYLAFVSLKNSHIKNKIGKIKLLSIKDLLNEISWNDNKDLLKRVLTKAINREVYFDKKERGQ